MLSAGANWPRLFMPDKSDTAGECDNSQLPKSIIRMFSSFQKRKIGVIYDDRCIQSNKIPKNNKQVKMIKLTNKTRVAFAK